MLTGILCGLGGAVGQDWGCILTRRYVQSGRTPGGLLIHSQLQLGAWSLALTAALYSLYGLPHSQDFWLPLCGAAIGSGGGQFFFFRAEQTMEPSRVSSLMGLRVVIVVLISALALGEHFFWNQWLGVALAALSAPLLNYEGGSFRKEGTGNLAVALGFLPFCWRICSRKIRKLFPGKFGCSASAPPC